MTPGHEAAVKKAGIIHRDISAGNLLIYEFKDESGEMKRKGILNDWELSKPLAITNRRQPERTVSGSLVRDVVAGCL